MFCPGLQGDGSRLSRAPRGVEPSLFEDAHGGFDNLAPRLFAFRPKPPGFTGFETKSALPDHIRWFLTVPRRELLTTCDHTVPLASNTS